MDKYIYSDVAIYIYMVGGIPTPLKNMNVSWDDYSQYMEKKMFQTTNQIYTQYTDIDTQTYTCTVCLYVYNWLYVYNGELNNWGDTIVFSTKR